MIFKMPKDPTTVETEQLLKVALKGSFENIIKAIVALEDGICLGWKQSNTQKLLEFARAGASQAKEANTLANRIKETQDNHEKSNNQSMVDLVSLKTSSKFITRICESYIEGQEIEEDTWIDCKTHIAHMLVLADSISKAQQK